VPVFNYSGRNARGELMRGHLESQNPQAVAAWMLDAGITPITIKAPAEDIRPAWLRKLNESALNDVDLLLFTRQMGAMMKAGVAALQALAAIQKSTLKPRLVRLLKEMSDDLDNGLELSAAIAHHPKFFNDYYVSMVRVGEGGRLEEVSAACSTSSSSKQMKQKIKGAVRYPMFVMMAIAIGIAILNFYVIPSFAKVYGGFGAELPLLTRILVGTSNFTVTGGRLLRRWLSRLCIPFLAATRDGRYILDNKLWIPIIGSIIVKATNALP
jgi:MSHA biogenesis protein MshG